MILDALSRKVPLVFLPYSNHFSESCVCDSKSKVCMFGECAICSDSKLFDEAFLSRVSNDVSGMKISWYQWEKVNEKQAKVQHTGPICEAIDLLKSQLSKFLRHVFVKRAQSSIFEVMKTERKLSFKWIFQKISPVLTQTKFSPPTGIRISCACSRPLCGKVAR